MKTTLIMLDTPIIVSKDKHKLNDFVYNNGKIEQRTIGGITSDQFYWNAEKIIAGIEGLPSIDWNGLEEKFGWVDVEKLTDIYVTEQYKKSDNPKYFDAHRCRKSFFDGFKKAQSLNKKKLSSLEETVDIIDKWVQYKKDTKCKGLSLESFIKSLQQPKVFDIEVEMENNQCDGCKAKLPLKDGIHKDNQTFGIGCTKDRYNQPKITNNSIKILKKLT